MKYAIIESGGKQFRAVEGSTVEVDLLPLDAGQQYEPTAVLLVVDGDKISVGTPIVSGAKVQTTILEHTKGPKLTVFKYRPKKRIRVKTGHRQKYTLLKIDSISLE